jgi:hypothetical protein
MRLRLMASYHGIPYQAGLGPDGHQVTLFSPAPPPEELGFTAGPGHWRKQVSVTDLSALWQSRPVGDYRGEPCLVLDDLGDRLHIAYLGRDATRAAQLGYWEIDREVFEVMVARPDVTGLVEQRVDFPLAAAMFPAAGPESQTGGPATAVTEMAGQAGYDRAAENGGSAAAVYVSGPPAIPGSVPGNGSGVLGNGRPEGYAGAGRGSRMPDRMAAWHGSPAPVPWTGREPGSDPGSERQPGRDPGGKREPGPEPGTTRVPPRRSGRKDRIAPESVFAELLNLAAIPQAAYAVDEEVPGAMCLVEANGGFEVFSRTDHARLEVRFFEDEEAAYFYLFGVLAAEAIRSGRLAPIGPDRANGHGNGAGVPGTTAATENVSKYLRGSKWPKSPSHTGIVN